LDKKTEYKLNEFLNFKLILYGKAIDYLPYFIYNFSELERIGIGKIEGSIISTRYKMI
jgi:hypothetical protein